MSRKYTCGVPKEHCNGSHTLACFGLRGLLESQRKVHSSHEEAFNCRARYLTKVLGYERIGGREFRPPDGGPVLVLCKKSRFGGELRGGKGEESSRVMPTGKGTGGMIVAY